MNQIVDVTSIVSAVPLPAEQPKMTRREKLLRWAFAIRAFRGDHRLVLFHGLEYFTAEMLNTPIPQFMPPTYATAFSVAAADPVLSEAGFKGETASEVMGFFELTQPQLHEFSCNCGGVIGNDEMAHRIERLAG